MMAITTNLSPKIHKIVIDGQTQDFQMVPQYSSCLRDDLVFFENKPDKDTTDAGGAVFSNLNRAIQRAGW